MHQREGVCAPAAEDESRDRHPVGVVDVGIDCWAVTVRCQVAAIPMRRRPAAVRCPRLALPVCEGCWGLLGHALPPHISLSGDGDVGEDRIRGNGCIDARVLNDITTASRIIEASLRVDRIQAPVAAHIEPCTFIPNAPDLPAWYRRDKHGKARLPTGRGQECTRIVLRPLGRRDADDDTPRGDPFLFAANRGTQPQGEAGLGQDGVGPIGAAIGPELPGLVELSDQPVRRVAGPADI
mmetsp:Transcript_13039/g.23461  ORF Transcript_13039/g.23461 Transcript_13039/m.23461 type:complete len:238 (+) Transcript_13039:4108-4821(+)